MHLSLSCSSIEARATRKLPHLLMSCSRLMFNNYQLWDLVLQAMNMTFPETAESLSMRLKASSSRRRQTSIHVGENPQSEGFCRLIQLKCYCPPAFFRSNFLLIAPIVTFITESAVRTVSLIPFQGTVSTISLTPCCSLRASSNSFKSAAAF
jgi:hypothetical protein